MPQVASKSRFPPLSLRTKLLLLSLGCVVLIFGSFLGWKYWTAAKLAKEQSDYTTAMTRAEDYSKSSMLPQAVAVLETYLKGNRPLDHRYQAMISLAYSYQLNNQADQSFATLKRVDALGVTPSNVYVLRSLAFFSTAHNDKPSAIRYYIRALAVAKSKYDPEATPYIPQWEADLKMLESTP